jgi:predicted secreted hydrolase
LNTLFKYCSIIVVCFIFSILIYVFIYSGDKSKSIETSNLSLLNLLSDSPNFIEGQIPQSNYEILLPEDHYDHSNFRNEWWYFTGNLKDTNQKEFGYQFTIFRFNNNQDDINSLWSASDIYLGHLAISDIDEAKYFSKEVFFRNSELGFAGGDIQQNKIWISNWEIKFDGDTVHLSARQDELIVDLILESKSPPVYHGDNGYSEKGSENTNASYYYSITDYETNGKITINNKIHEVSGKSWFDHEWSSGVLPNDVVGWDWFSLRFDEGSQLMIYQLRDNAGLPTKFSAGTFIEKNTQVIKLNSEQFELNPVGNWNSDLTDISYPLQWEIKISDLNINIRIKPKINNQEFNNTIIYWEGAVNILNNSNQRIGEGYMELTGYK